MYLVSDVQSGRIYALKRVLIQNKEQLQEVKHEIDVHTKLCRHFNIMSLLDNEIVNIGNNDQGDLLRQAHMGNAHKICFYDSLIVFAAWAEHKNGPGTILFFTMFHSSRKKQQHSLFVQQHFFCFRTTKLF